MSFPSVITGEHGPASSGLIAWMKSIFGKAYTVSRGYSSGHDGMDLPAKAGTPVKAIASGTVSYAKDARKQVDRGVSGWAKYGGNVVNIDIGGQKTTQYAHLQSFIVKEGQYVNAGDIIGYVGSTGGSPDSATANFSGPHVHFGLWDRKINRMVNPQSFFENIGDTSGGGTTTANLIAKLLGKSLSDKLTETDVQKILSTPKEQGGYGLPVGSIPYQEAYLRIKPYIDQPIGSFPNITNGGTTLGDTDPFGIAKVGTQLADTFTWIGFILIGIVFIGGGIYLLGGSEKVTDAAKVVV